MAADVSAVNADADGVAVMGEVELEVGAGVINEDAFMVAVAVKGGDAVGLEEGCLHLPSMFPS